MLQAAVSTHVLSPGVFTANAESLFHLADERIAAVTQDIVIKILIPFEPVIEVGIDTPVANPA